ncbi:MAG: GNAT family N-acetyltransferase [bacterium]|nr:GNAT family N-acetyltransferase [bacterium]
MVLPLKKESISKVVDLHKQVLGHTLNARIGSWFLEKLYEETMLAKENGRCFVSFEDEKVVGFVSICLDYEALSSRIMSSLTLVQKIKVSIFMGSHFWLIPDFFKKQLFSRYIKANMPQPYPMVLTIGVDSNQQGNGIGKQLMHEVKTSFRKHNLTEFYLDTEETNEQAIGFYKKIGFDEIARKYGNVVLQYKLN